MGAKIYKRFGDPTAFAEKNPEFDRNRELAKRLRLEADARPHDLSHADIEAMDARAREFKVHERALELAQLKTNRTALQSILPEGATLSPKSMQRSAQLFSGPSMGGFGNQSGNTFMTSTRPYQPEFDSPDRQMFPVHRRMANMYWRLFYKMDPIIGAVIELFSTLPWSDFKLTGEGVDGEIKDTMEHMVKETKLLTMLPYFVSEWLSIGEVIPHLFFNEDRGIWEHITLHNPDQIDVVYSPFLKMDPIMEYVPTQSLREVVSSNHPMLTKIRESMPEELVGALHAGKNIPLAPTNASFIARRLHPYELRGTSIISRMWRTLMLEDAWWSASIATGRRAASPLKVAKIGNPATGAFASPAEEARTLRLLAQAETDPQAWLVVHHEMSFELAGDPQRVLNIGQYYDFIERVKLTALGVSKAFIAGESSYSSAAAGLTTFLQRLKAIRDFFVAEWLIPKFFLPVAMVNGWVKNKPASNGQVRVKRSSNELFDEQRYIIPTIEWEKTLDPNIDKDRLEAMRSLENDLHIKISEQRKYAVMGLDNEEEQKKIVAEVKFKRDLAGEDPLLQAAIGLLPGGEDGMGGGGGGIMPGVPPIGGEGEGGVGEGGEAPPPPSDAAPPPTPEGASIQGDAGAEPKPNPHWSESTLKPLVQLFKDFEVSVLIESDEEPWVSALKSSDVRQALQAHDPEALWEALEGWLVDQNFPATYIDGLRGSLADRQALPKKASVSFDDFAAQLGITGDEFDTPFMPEQRKK